MTNPALASARPALHRLLLAVGCAAAGLLPSIEAPAASSAARPGAAAPVDFNYQIKPILSDRCFTCHGPDEKARKARLRLDTKDGAFKTLTNGQFIIKPGDPAGSELFRRITSTDPDEVMPPAKANLALSKEEVELMRRWIEQGAEWKRHWSFIPLSSTPIPPVRPSSRWPRNNIDRFVLARLEAEKLQPSPAASRERLLRRVTFDLTGLPPTPAEIDAFLADRSADAFEKVVDRLLDSPAYGERMAVEWLDVARYADTFGYQTDRDNALWPWRDWVISAFNRNVRFNDFIVWQIAGDLLPNPTREQRLATAFNRNHRQTNEGGSVDEEFRVEYNADRVHTTAGAFLGLTFECARCHDHKYDPVSQKDYYRLFAFFNSTDESGLYSHFTSATPTPTLLLFKDSAQETQYRDLLAGIATREQQLAGLRRERRAAAERWSRETGDLPALTGLVGHYSFDAIVSNQTANLAGTNFPARLTESPESAPGRTGQALRFSGENSVTIDRVANFRRTDPFSFSLWFQIPEEQPEIVVLHHQQAGSDAGYQGYQLILENGQASFALIHFWPGNALKIRTRDKLPLHQWLHLGVTYDGSSHAAGLRLFINGQVADTAIVSDRLHKDIANGAPLTLGARFRGRGFKGGLIDELKIFNRCLSPLEMSVASSLRTVVAPAAGAALADRFQPPATAEELAEYYLETSDAACAAALAELRKEREAANALIGGVGEIMTMGDRPEPRPTYVLRRGAYDAHGDVVEPATPESILPLDPQLPRNRLGLARWLVDARNPLTARVIVNRYWQIFFGRGLVLTAEDFGSQGTLPTHPQLLDWLAKEFIDSGWDLKALHKLIVSSATYRQSSTASPALLARDPDNKLLARGPRNRLTAEMLRDNALAAARLLVPKIGGPSVRPYQPEGLWEEKSGLAYTPDKGEGLYRRSMYTYWKRTSPHPMMTLFDASERNTCTVRRQATSTPLQALVLLNDPQFVEAARHIGERALQEGGSSLNERITFIFRVLTSRKPSSRELAILRRLHQEQLELATAERTNGTDRTQRTQRTQGTQGTQGTNGAVRGPAVDQAELAAATALAEAVLNFDDAVYKR